MHQFDKVEMFAFVAPEESPAEHERLLAIEEELMQALELPYRVVNIAVDDLGSSAAKKYDIEAWLPGQERYRELTSCSNTTDFQARRLDVRYRPADGSGPRHAHTLNGTAVAVGRTIIALAENGQQEDGSGGAARGAAGVRSARADRAVARLIYATIASLDGFVADEDGNFDWAAPDEEVHSFGNDLERTVGTHLYGRRMYEVLVAW